MAGSKVKVELIESGIIKLLRSQEILEVCHDAAKEMAAKAGDGFETSPYVGANRANASVYAATEEAAARDMDSDALLRSMNI